MKTIHATSLILMLLVATTVNAQTQTGHKIKTLPMIKLGESDPRAKALPHPKIVRKPPERNPYQWIMAPEKEIESRQWTLKSGTNITATLVKFNKLTVAVKTDDDKELYIIRSALDDNANKMLSGFEAEFDKARIEEWNKKQEEKNTP